MHSESRRRISSNSGKNRPARTVQPIPLASYAAYSFQRQNAARRGFELVLPAASRQAQCQIVWNVDFQRADMIGKFTITSSREDLILLEFSVDPAVTLADVAGPDVRRWQLQDARLQVWLRQPKRQTTLDIAGWRAVPHKGNVPVKQTVALPSVYPLQTAITDGTLGIASRPRPSS